MAERKKQMEVEAENEYRNKLSKVTEGKRSISLMELKEHQI
jgi:hypothetical protein